MQNKTRQPIHKRPDCHKGYISEADKEILLSVRVNLVTPYKCNPIEGRIPCIMGDATKVRLHDRHRIENAFCGMDKFKKVFVRTN
jgi:hypothetical protein